MINSHEDQPKLNPFEASQKAAASFGFNGIVLSSPAGWHSALNIRGLGDVRFVFVDPTRKVVDQAGNTKEVSESEWRMKIQQGKFSSMKPLAAIVARSHSISGPKDWELIPISEVPATSTEYVSVPSSDEMSTRSRAYSEYGWKMADLSSDLIDRIKQDVQNKK